MRMCGVAPATAARAVRASVVMKQEVSGNRWLIKSANCKTKIILRNDLSQIKREVQERAPAEHQKRSRHRRHASTRSSYYKMALIWCIFLLTTFVGVWSQQFSSNAAQQTTKLANFNQPLVGHWTTNLHNNNNNNNKQQILHTDASTKTRTITKTNAKLKIVRATPSKVNLWNNAVTTSKRREVRQTWPISRQKSGSTMTPTSRLLRYKSVEINPPEMRSGILRAADVFLIKPPSSSSSTTSERSLMTRAAVTPTRNQQSPMSQQQQQVSSALVSNSGLVSTDTSARSKKCALILQRTYVRKSTPNEISSSSSTALDDQQVDSLEPTGRMERVCITYEHVNGAIEEAKRRLNFVSNSEQLQEAVQSIEPASVQVAQLGELNQETTKLLSTKFDLSPDEILNGLPLIDMSRTNFWPICPLMVRPIECDPTGRFRSFTGHCNNLEQPAWGAAQTPFVRFLAPRHPDGIERDRVSVLDGSPLPAPRVVTASVHRDVDRASNELSLLVMVWGQVIDHDVAQAAPPRDEQGLDFNCCKEPGRQHPLCKPIEIPENDPLYSRFGQRCMDFKRSLAGLRPNCALGPRVHINTITATIDANTVYGSSRAVADSLRSFTGGQMKTQDVFRNRSPALKPLLPRQTVRPDLDCFERPQGAYCFLAGDDRVNEQPTLTAMHTIYVRDHNRMASELSRLNPHWDDDRLYHETRHIAAAMIQHVLIREYLPLLIGRDTMRAYNLTEAPKNTYWNGYEPNVTPSISQAFSTAAFRQGHTFIQGKVRLHDSQTHAFIDSIQLRRLFKRPFHYYQPGRLDQVLAGIVNTPSQTYDPFITEEIAGHLFQEPGDEFGMDLTAINLARAREQGVPGYNSYREWCGLGRVRSFEELVPVMANRTAFKYAMLYKHVDDIDLWSAGVSERPLAGALVGPTFACIIGRQFANIKRGDRFWYENAQQPSSFTLDQLREIKRATQARLLCKNSDNMRTIQRQALKLAHPILNPQVKCDEIADIDLSYWREDPNNLGSFFSSSSANNQ